MYKCIQIEQPTIIIVVVIQLNLKNYGGHFKFKNSALKWNFSRRQHPEMDSEFLKLGLKYGCRLFPPKASRTLSRWISEKSLYTITCISHYKKC